MSMLSLWSRLTFLLTILSTCLSKRPNILFLNVDEMDGRNMDPTSSDQYNAINMPNLRSMASRGTQFIRHYTNGPQCVCGRSAMWTGRRTNEIHVYNNAFGIAAMSNGTLDKSCISTYNSEICNMMRIKQNINITMFDAMKLLGYNVYIYGKLHIGGGIMDLATQKNATDEAFESAININSLASITRSANILKSYDSDPMSSYNDNSKNPHATDENVITKCLQRLQTLGKNNVRENSNNEQPWMLYCSVDIPHPPYESNSTWIKYVNINNITIPQNLNETKYNQFDKYQSISDACWNDNWSDQQIIDFRKTYYGLNAQTDYMMGEVMNSLFENGFTLNDTYIIFTSDHGEMNLDHRQYGKNSMYEGATRIPLFIVGPNVPIQTITNLTQIIDMFPTLVDIATMNHTDSNNDNNNIDQSYINQLAGSSLMPFINKNEINNHPNYITSQYHALKANTGSFMIRKDEYKYIVYGNYLKEFENYTSLLFNINNDPNEMNDISNENEIIVNQLDTILKQTYNYQYADCMAKKQDIYFFNTFVWNVYNQTQIYQALESTYHGFNQTDWNKIVKWRHELTNAPNCSTFV